MSRIVLITSDHRRHLWLAGILAQANMLAAVVSESKPVGNPASRLHADPAVASYFAERDRREAHWFHDAPEHPGALGVPLAQVPWGHSNSPEIHDFVRNLSPDYVLLFGSSIIREPLLDSFASRIVNMHLGLSPYYRGSGTNFWPLVDGLPECVGVTIHHATLRVDGGAILAQARPMVAEDDESHDLGCKTIMAGAQLIVHLFRDNMPLPDGTPQTGEGKLCRRADFTPHSLGQLRDNFKAGMIPRYLMNKEERDAHYPIVTYSPPLSKE